MSTIWGFFSPVGYHEAEGRVTWRPDPGLSAWASGSWRRYEEANATVIFRPIARDGTRVQVGASWRPVRSLTLDGSYRMDRGFGAFLSSGDVGVHWQATPRLALSLDGTAFQQIEQFRVGEGIVYGGGGSADIAVLPGLTLMGGANVYRQTFENRPGMEDWNQLRAWTSLRASFGRDPGQRGSGRPMMRNAMHTRHIVILAILAVAAVGGTLGTIALNADRTERFPHALHARMFPLCEGCHEGSRRATSRVLPAAPAVRELPRRRPSRGWWSGPARRRA
jgi:hypothetical protein